jgi:hypothetical protein
MLRHYKGRSPLQKAGATKALGAVALGGLKTAHYKEKGKGARDGPRPLHSEPHARIGGILVSL